MKFLLSVSHAIRGIVRVARTESNFRIHLFFSALAVVCGFWFDLSPEEWIRIIVAIALVLCFEIINTALEKILDMIKPRFDNHVGAIKDMTAGAVFIASVAALVVGFFTFLPYIVLAYSYL